MREELPPRETQLEWIRFLDTEPSISAMADWLTLKAAETGWDFYDLSLALSSIKQPRLPDEPEEKGN